MSISERMAPKFLVDEMIKKNDRKQPNERYGTVGWDGSQVSSSVLSVDDAALLLTAVAETALKEVTPTLQSEPSSSALKIHCKLNLGPPASQRSQITKRFALSLPSDPSSENYKTSNFLCRHPLYPTYTRSLLQHEPELVLVSTPKDVDDYKSKENFTKTSHETEGSQISALKVDEQSSSDTFTKSCAQKQCKLILRKKFSWKRYPDLEAFLISNREEYFQYSSLNYSIQQKVFNNSLTHSMIKLATEQGYIFDGHDFNFITVRDRIRCYYKSYVQTLKKQRASGCTTFDASHEKGWCVSR